MTGARMVARVIVIAIIAAAWWVVYALPVILARPLARW